MTKTEQRLLDAAAAFGDASSASTKHLYAVEVWSDAERLASRRLSETRKAASHELESAAKAYATSTRARRIRSQRQESKA